MSLGLLLFFLFLLVANVAIGYIIAILLGIGPPDFRTAWTKIKLSVPSHRSESGGFSSRLPQIKNIAGFITSFVGRFRKHADKASDELEPASELSDATPIDESTETLPVSPP